MTRYYAIRIVDGRHVVGVTTDGIDWVPLPNAIFGRPRDAIRYAEMRQQDVSPLRSADEGGGAVRAVIPPSSAEPSELTFAGRAVPRGPA